MQWEFGPCPLKDICNCAWQGKHADVFWHSAFSHKKFIKVWDPYEWIKLRDFEDSCDKEYIKRVLIRNDDTDKVFVFTVVVGINCLSMCRLNSCGSAVTLFESFNCVFT